MKKNVLRISILPLMLLMAISFTGLQPQKDNDKGNKGNNKGEKGNQNGQGRGNQGNKNEDRSWDGQGKGKKDHDDRGMSNSGDQGNGNNKNKGNSGHGKDKGYGDDKMSKNNKNKNKENGNGKFRQEIIRWDRVNDIQWGFDNYASRKSYKNYKKVTICHNTGNREYPVTISVSENAMKAHLNHGDQVGDCRVNFSDRWPVNYIRSRENVYNSYESTWENISYSEALLRFAAEKLLGVKSTFQTQRPNLTSQEIQRKEMLIMELQNNVNSLENQLDATRQRTDGININIML